MTLEVARLDRVEESEPSATVEEENGAAAGAAVDERHRVDAGVRAAAVFEGVIGAVCAEIFLSGSCAPLEVGAAEEGDDVAAVAGVDPQPSDAAVEAECDQPRSVPLSGRVMAAAANGGDTVRENRTLLMHFFVFLFVFFLYRRACWRR